MLSCLVTEVLETVQLDISFPYDSQQHSQTVKVPGRPGLGVPSGRAAGR